jgi:dTDP-4-amino-4,6-dideoxygalactose transaminase
MSEKRNIPISLPSTGQEEWEAVKEPLMSGWITSGPKVRAFEEAFAKRHEVKHAIAVTSATTALHLALVALDIGPGDEVIVPAFTWVSTANVVLHQGAEVIFCDVDTKTFNIDPVQLSKKVTPKTKAIMAVHLFGLCADMDMIRAVAPNIPIIEDGACATGAAYKGVPAGGLGDMGCFSFHPRKSITTGEGGMVTTNDDVLAEKLSILRNHGASISEEQRHNGPKPYILPGFEVCGYNYRMTDLQGAMGVVQLAKLDQFITERQKWANYYNEQLSGIDWLNLPEFSNEYTHGWQSYVTLVDESKSPMTRNEIMEKLQDSGISTRPGTHAVHMLGFYAKKYGIQPGDFPEAQSSNDFSMSIPLHNRMTKEDFDYVINCLKNLT